MFCERIWQDLGPERDVRMSRTRYTPEQIIGMLRQTEVELAQGRKVPEVCRSLGVSEQSYYRWRNEYVGLKVDP
jgi:transposase-like protein